MKKVYSLLLLISFLFVYLEWGKGMHSFVYQIEYAILTGNTDTKNVFTHPLVALPFIGQLILLITLFLKKTNRKLTITGIALMGTLVLMCLIAGILSANIRIIGAALPYFLLAWLALKNGNKKSGAAEDAQSNA